MHLYYFDSVLQVGKLYKLLLTVIKLEISKMEIFDIHASQALLLYKIGKNHPSIGDLANNDLFWGSNASYIVGKLCKRGYLRIKKAKHDQRVSLVELTKKGLNFWKNINKALVKHNKILSQKNIDIVGLNNFFVQTKSLENCFYKIIHHLGSKN